jgi:hypothetical protein
VWGPDRLATYRCSSVSHIFSVGRKPSANYIETRRLSTLQIDVGVGRETPVAKVSSTGRTTTGTAPNIGLEPIANCPTAFQFEVGAWVRWTRGHMPAFVTDGGRATVMLRRPMFRRVFVPASKGSPARG